MSRYYKCDLCGTPYAPIQFENATAYIESGNKDFNGNASGVHIYDICPDCKNKILDFMHSLEPKEEEDA